ncbi:tRNA pseudouridine synthase B [Alsobacter metallidurans]|uniref:tRNA pseudouridine synthase B n=1 Tax=Alsobacter metallidurans TaxID=340221 RepID=A0A917MKD4_9HYPH|nr:tRNA pseudouridine(55) synthase TruB [Alsobacter metallidurans]GGH34104.1 tRNA pseudouridine synthase B [Alsobacter metallidurans]
MNAPRRNRVDVHGWIVLDKPVGMTSTHAVAAMRRLLNAKKAGHAGTLDPLASGILPLAFGEATKTVPYVVDGEKAYTFTVAWGVETDTDDTEGRAVATSDKRPALAEIEAVLPRFIGIVSQVPPRYSAIKIDGERAYDLARDGEQVEMVARDVHIHALRIVAADENSATFEAECGKGTYVRAIARDMGRALGCLGHVTALRRTRVGPFTLADATPWADMADDPKAASEALLPVEGGLTELDCVVLSRDGAARLKRGQSVILRGRDAPAEGGPLYAACGGVVIAVGMVEKGEFIPSRVFNLPF